MGTSNGQRGAKEPSDAPVPDLPKTSLPPAVLQCYQNDHGRPDQIILALDSDLSADGGFGEQWLIIDHENLRVIACDPGPAAGLKASAAPYNGTASIHANGKTNGSLLNGHAHLNGSANGNGNGHANGHANGKTNGHTNGLSSKAAGTVGQTNGAAPTAESAILRFRFALHQIEGARLEPCIGNGLLEITTGGQPQVLVHFSNELTDGFARIAHYLQQRADSGPTVVVPNLHSEEQRCLSCGRRLLDPSIKVCPTCIDRGNILGRLILLAKAYWGRSMVLVLLLLAGVIVDLLPPYLTRVLIDSVLTPAIGGTPPQNGGIFGIGALLAPLPTSMALAFLVGGLLSLQIIRVLVTVGNNVLMQRISSCFTADVREMMFAHLKRLSIEFFDRNESGRLLTRINNDTEELQGLIQQFSTVTLSLLMVLGIGAVLFSMAASLGLFVLIPGPFVLVATFSYHRYMQPHFRRYWTARWRLNSMLSTFLSGIQVVKAFAQEDQEETRYQDRNRRTRDARLRVDLAWGRFFPFVSFAFGAGGLIIWYAGGNAVLANQITLGTLIAFLSYLGMFYGPLSNLTQISQALNRFLTISQRIFEFLDETPKVQQTAQPISQPAMRGQIEFDHVTFGYDPYFPVLKDISFAIQPGELIGIVGHSGAGKTTLASLLCRFYDVTGGAIRIDGTDIRELSIEELRRQIGIVLQSPFLFRGTLSQNIAYGKPNATREEIIRAAKAANAHHFITNFPEGYDTIVGEGGTGLSGGERQRISIARAILLNPRILILDEATSSVDTETERQIQEALDTLVKGRTTIAIAHRLSTLSNATRIISLNHGRLEEIGTPQALMEQKGLFFNLVQMQSKFARLEGVVAV
ncbi:MAG: ABC transporter ATP-binding protein [Chloroflexi bacterium]|nr:ABC transporter ATP-binding protein [Chloroflexota bacterium]